MRLAVPRLRVFVSFVALVLAAGPRPAEAQPITTVARAGWRVGGNVSAAARLGNVLYIGGGIRGIAPEANVAAGVLAVDAATGAIIPGFALINGNVIALEPDGVGGFYVGGNFLDTVVGGTVQPRIRLAHLLANGAIDTTFAATVEGGPIRALELVPGIGLFVGGDFSGLNGAARSRVGLLDPTTGATQPWTYNVAGSNASVRALAYDAGQLVVGGTFATVDALARANLVVVSASAVGQVGPDNGVDALVEALYTPAAGTVYVGGGFATALGSPRARLARVAHAAGALTLALDPWNPGADGNVRTFAGGAGTVFAGGDFFTLGGAQRRRLGELDVATGAPTAFDGGVEGVINAVALAGGRLYTGGAFNDAGGAERNAAAALSSADATALAWNPSPAGVVTAVAVSGNTVLLGGTIVGYGAIARSNLAALDLQAGTVLPWNPRADGGQIDEIIILGNRIFVSGNFFFIGGEQRFGVAELDPVFGEATEWNPVLNGAVTAMVLDGTSAYLGGQFTTVNGQPRTRLARVDLATGALDPTFTPSATGGAPMDLLLAGSTLYVGGAFTAVNTVSTLRVAALNATTGAFVPGFSASADNTVQKLDLDGGFLYMGGSFAAVNGTTRDAVARVVATTGVLDAWAPDVETPAGAVFGFTRSINDIDAVNGVVILSGAFETVGGQTRLGVATVDTATGAPTTWAPQLGTPPLGGFGGAILTYPDLTVIGGARIQLADELLNGLALFIEPAATRVLPPTAFTATIAGSTVTFRWALSPLGLSGVSFVLEAGSGPGLRNIATLPVGSGTSFSVGGVPPGTYYVRVRSVHVLGTSAASPEIAVTVGGVGCVSPPQPPGGFDFQYDEGTGLLQIDWSAGPGEPPSGFILQAGSQPGSSNIAVLPLGPATALQVPGVPPGAYWVRMLARNACGISAPSSDFPLFVDTEAAAPLAPLGLIATAAGGVVQISWVEPPFLPVTSYILEAGSAPGLSNLATIPVTGTTFSVPGVPPGIYYLRVRAVNALGAGGASAEFILIVS